MCTIADLLGLFWSLKELKINIYDGRLIKIVHVREDIHNLYWSNDRLNLCDDVEVEYLSVNPYKLPKNYKKLNPMHVNSFNDSLIVYVDLENDRGNGEYEKIVNNDDGQISGQISLEDL